MSDQDENQSSQVSVTIPSNAKFLKIVRRVTKTYFQAHPFPDEDIRHIVLAVDEACSNVIKYAYNLDETKKIRVSLSGVPNGIKISIRDYGVKADLDTIKPRAEACRVDIKSATRSFISRAALLVKVTAAILLAFIPHCSIR